MPRELRPCGTPAAYRRHLRHGEEPCVKCLRAESGRRYSPRMVCTMHGTVAVYNSGCGCTACAGAKADYQRRWVAAAARLAVLAPEIIPHGLGGYVNYRCRCEVCTAANSAASARYRAWRRGAGAS